jgi:AsmA protein
MRSLRLWAWAGAAFALIVALLAYPWSLDPRGVAERLNNAAPLPDGLTWQAPESASLRLFPRPLVELTGLRLVNADGRKVLSASAAVIALFPPRLIVGKVEIIEAGLRDLTFDLDLDALGERLPSLVAHFHPLLRRLNVNGGRVRLTSKKLGLDDELTELNGFFAWRKPAARLSFAANGVFRGAPLSVEGALETPQALAEGGASDAGLDLSASLLSLKFHGRWDRAADPAFSGDLALAAPSLNTVGAWLGLKAFPVGPTFPFAVSGQLAASREALTLANATLTIAEQKFDGSLRLSGAKGRWAASATLGADRIDLDPLIGPLPSPFESERCWSPSAWTAPLDPALDLDFRVSAGRASWGPILVSDAALAVTRRAGDWTFRVLDSSLDKGAFSAEASLSDCAERCKERAVVALSNVDLSELLRPFGVEALSGRASLKVEAAAEGETPEAVVASAHAQANFNAENGAILGLDFEDALRRNQRRPLDIARDLTTGQTPFDSAAAELAIDGGLARIVAARLAGPGVNIESNGEIDLSGCAWRTRFEASQADAQGAPTSDAARLNLELSGSWTHPSLSAAP